jgi:hypothetical protein
MPTLKELEHVQRQWKDDFALNSLMRRELREEKKVTKEQADSDQKFLDKWNINVSLVREHEVDVKIASMYKFNSLDTNTNDEEFSEEARASKRKSIGLESIFESQKNAKRLVSSSSSKQLQIKGLVTKLNRSLQEKQLEKNDLDSNDKFFNTSKVASAAEELDCDSLKLKLAKFIRPSVSSSGTSGAVGSSSLVSNCYGDSGEESSSN